MSLGKLLGIKPPKPPEKEERDKTPKIDLFTFVKAIQHTKEPLIVDEWSEGQYNPFMVNRALSMSPETVIQANEMNSRPHLGKKLQFLFLLGTIRPKKRFDSWIKVSSPEEDLGIIKAYYGYSNAEAFSALRILTGEQIEEIRVRSFKGGGNR